MRTPLFALTAILLTAAPVAAQVTTRDHRTPRPAAVPPPAPAPVAVRTPVAFDSRGLVLLGEQRAERRSGREILRLPASASRRFDRITLVANGGDLDLERVNVRFADRSRWLAPTRHQFRAGGEIVAIDLPNDQRELDTIEVGYRAARAQRGTTIQVWGRPRPAPPKPTPARWDNRGWSLIGEQWVERRSARMTFKTTTSNDIFTRVMLVVEESDLELRDMKVSFSNGSSFKPKLERFFREGDRTHAIDLPAGARTVRRIDLKANNVPGGGRAKVAVWGLTAAAPAPTPPVAIQPPPPRPPFTWRSAGWNKLGEQWVEGRRDRIDIQPGGGGANKLNKLTIVVTESDLELFDMVVTFSNGETFRPQMKHVFRENDRTRAIDLPAGTRTVRNVSFRAGNLPGGGRAKIELYGQ